VFCSNPGDLGGLPGKLIQQRTPANVSKRRQASVSGFPALVLFQRLFPIRFSAA
jgi:hypothetical protein